MCHNMKCLKTGMKLTLTVLPGFAYSGDLYGHPRSNVLVFKMNRVPMMTEHPDAVLEVGAFVGKDFVGRLLNLSDEHKEFHAKWNEEMPVEMLMTRQVICVGNCG